MGAFDAGPITSDARALLLGVTNKIAMRPASEGRGGVQTEPAVATLISQRVSAPGRSAMRISMITARCTTIRTPLQAGAARACARRRASLRLQPLPQDQPRHGAIERLFVTLFLVAAGLASRNHASPAVRNAG